MHHKLRRTNIKEEKVMNTLKRKLTAILLTLAMLLSLMPAFPQAAEAALDKTTVNNDAIQVEYTANGAFNSTVEVMVQDEEGNLLAKEPLILKNIVSNYFKKEEEVNGNRIRTSLCANYAICQRNLRFNVWDIRPGS